MEQWKDVPGFEGLYCVSDRGVVWSHRRKRPLKPEILKPAGHLRVDLVKRDGTRQRELVHRIVLRTFVGPRPEGLVVRHLDGNPKNNEVGNLKYGTASENTLDSVAHGTHNTAGKRKSHCPQGHEYSAENTYVSPSNEKDRRCRECARTRNRESYRARVGLDISTGRRIHDQEPVSMKDAE